MAGKGLWSTLGDSGGKVKTYIQSQTRGLGPWKWLLYFIVLFALFTKPPGRDNIGLVVLLNVIWNKVAIIEDTSELAKVQKKADLDAFRGISPGHFREGDFDIPGAVKEGHANIPSDHITFPKGYRKTEFEKGGALACATAHFLAIKKSSWFEPDLETLRRSFRRLAEAREEGLRRCGYSSEAVNYMNTRVSGNYLADDGLGGTGVTAVK